MVAKTDQTQDFEEWLSSKPYWEQFVWKLNLEKDSLDEGDVNDCYKFLSEHLGLIEPLKEEKQKIYFKNQILIDSEQKDSSKIKLLEIKNFENVNALSKDCSIKLGPNLTLIYGGNGAGKSGVSRLLCNACFSRGEREILPNVRENSAASPAKANFVLDVGSAEPLLLHYNFGDNHSQLKCFAVFDSESVLIHLDQSNDVKFTPGQIKIFDRVSDTILKLEEKLAADKKERKKDNPFDLIFPQDGTTESSVSQFCRSVSANTTADDFLKYANFNAQTDEIKITELQRQFEDKSRLDVPKKKLELKSEIQNLRALKTATETFLDCFSTESVDEINQQIADILEKKAIIQNLSAQSFNNGIFNAIGSAEWRTLINAAKEMYDLELSKINDKSLSHCILCHQKLSDEAKVLFNRYWEFLNSKAENELAQLFEKQKRVLRELREAQIGKPKFKDTDAGIKILKNYDSAYVPQLEGDVTLLSDVLTNWIAQIEKQEQIDRHNVPSVQLKKIDDLMGLLSKEESDLVDPSEELKEISEQLIALRHKKKVTAAKNKGLEYVEYLKWMFKANRAGFAGIKTATTKKRTEFFNAGVAKNYRAVFNEELKTMGCDFDLKMHTSGDKGNTVKEYRLNFAEDYNPSQILSEGEQNVCSLADFLTEVQLDNSNCGIIFDDPVTSLDHERKNKISGRLVLEANKRQVVIFTHDVVFMSQLVKHSYNNKINYLVHWMRKINGIPGCMEENSSPKLSCLDSLKKDYNEAIKNYASLGAKEQERSLGVAFDYLRSACEALIEEVLFAGTIQRYDDHVRVSNLEEAVFNQELALKIVELHGTISELALMHNRSDTQRENPPSIENFNEVKNTFEALEKNLKEALKSSRKDRATRKAAKATMTAGW